MADLFISHPTQIGTGMVLPFVRWAEITLSAEELEKYKAACVRQNAISVSEGIVQKSMTLGNPGQRQIPVGITITRPDIEPTFDPEWFEFWERYVADPSLSWTDLP